MQQQIFSIPVFGGSEVNDEMNRFIKIDDFDNS